MKVPGPDHPITISPAGKRIRVRFGDKTVADTTRALTLKEASYPAVYYIPRADADMSVMTATKHATHCPYKGAASYFRSASAAKPPTTRCGAIRSPTRRWPRSRTIWPFIRTRSRSRKADAHDPKSLSPA